MIFRNAVEPGRYLLFQTRSWRRLYHSSNGNEAPNIAVLGGGITGLATAYFITREIPSARLTLFEASPRLGGWLHSQQVDIGNGTVVFEQGPRTLRPSRPNGWVTIDLLRDLKLEDQVLVTSKSSLAAQNRFIYYPDHLVRVPAPGVSLWRNLYPLLTEPIYKGVFRSLLTEWAKPKRQDLDDESVGSFISRRYCKETADNFASAVIHGIYAGDIYQLSARSLLPYFWFGEAANGSLTNCTLRKWTLRSPRDEALNKAWENEPVQSEFVTKLRQSSVFTFKEGVGQLAATLEASLTVNPNATINCNKLVDKLELNEGEDQVEVILQNGLDRSKFSHVISTLNSKALQTIVRPQGSLMSLAATHSVTVMVVNLYFSNPALLPVHGFGYLLPRSLQFQQNPEFGLGVVFDSDASIGQDSVPGTKVTIMIGGHWWDGWDGYPDEDEGASMAKAILKRHLGISEDPQAIRVGLQRNCIPQYTVGHHARMSQGHQELQTFKGKLRVAGNSYTGVGLNDCVRAAKDVVTSLVKDERATGLESFAQ